MKEIGIRKRVMKDIRRRDVGKRIRMDGGRKELDNAKEKNRGCIIWKKME